MTDEQIINLASKAAGVPQDDERAIKQKREERKREIRDEILRLASQIPPHVRSGGVVVVRTWKDALDAATDAADLSRVSVERLQGDLDIEYVRADVATADPEPHVREKLPAIVKTLQGKRLYSMAYARGRRRERLNASGYLRPAPRNVVSAESPQRELRVILPEGGYANLLWPEELTADSAQMLSEMFSTAMQAFARAATAKIAAAPTESK